MKMIRREQITGAILAGGLARRMGGADKGLARFQGRPLIQHVVAKIRPQVDTIIVNANRHMDRYAKLGFPVVSDEEMDFAGPLAGIARVLEQAATPYVLIVACDMPFLPACLAMRLAKALAINDVRVTVAQSEGRLQPLCSLVERGVVDDLRVFRASGGSGVEKWLRRLRYATVDFSDRIEAFRNMNTPSDLEAATDYGVESASI